MLYRSSCLLHRWRCQSRSRQASIAGTVVYDDVERLEGIPFSPPLSYVLTLQDLFISELFFILGSGLIKISFALTLLRVVVLRLHVIALYVAMVLSVIMTIATFLFIALTCRPASYFWTSVIDPSGGSCIDFHIQIKGSYAHGAVMLFLDVMLGVVIPLHVLSGLQMPRRIKISAAALLSLGSL